MSIADSIRKRGFSSWYERELLRSHSHLLLLVFCAVAALGAVEAYSYEGSERLLMVVSLVLATALGAWAVRRYLFFLMRAEHIANQATCPACAVHGRLLVDADGGADAATGATATMDVCCRKCQHRWRIEW